MPGHVAGFCVKMKGISKALRKQSAKQRTPIVEVPLKKLTLQSMQHCMMHEPPNPNKSFQKPTTLEGEILATLAVNNALGWGENVVNIGEMWPVAAVEISRQNCGVGILMPKSYGEIYEHPPDYL